MKRKLGKKSLAALLGLSLAAGMLPAPYASAADLQNYLTDAKGGMREVIGKMTADNHEIIDINITDGKTHKISVYLLDEDNSGRWSMVDVIEPDTQKLIDSQSVYDFSDGVYLSYNISGHVQLRLTNVWTRRYKNSKDTAIHGIFIDDEDAVKKGVAKVTTKEAEENEYAQNMEYVNVLGRFTKAGESFELPFDKEVQSVELRFDGNVAPASENIDKIQVLKDGEPVAGTMRTGFCSVTFQPEKTMKDGAYEIVVPASLKNADGKEIGKAYTTAFSVKTDAAVTYFRNGMNYMTRRVEVSFNDRIASAPKGSIVYHQGDDVKHMELREIGQNGGKLYEIQNKILPSGTYTFTLPAGVRSVSGAVSEEAYVKEFVFDSTQLSAKIEAPSAMQADTDVDIKIKECIGYGEVRYAFTEEALKEASYVPVTETLNVNPGDLSGNQTLYVQFRVMSGEQAGKESPVLHKDIRMGILEEGALLTFDMQSTGAYDKDGFGSAENKTDGVFDLETNEWGPHTSNYISDGSWGFGTLFDQDRDSRVVTEEGIEYQLSTGIYQDGTPNVATGNGTAIPAPSANNYEKIYVLAAGKADHNVGTFTLNYTDGTSTTQEIDAHYWADAGKMSENVVFKGIGACLGWAGDNIYTMGVMRQYELKADESKILESVTLPKTSALIRVFAMTGKEADKIQSKAVVTDNKATVCKAGATQAEEEDMSYNQFMKLYGNDSVLAKAADVTDVTNIDEVEPGERIYDSEILKEAETPTGAYGQSLYPFARQPEKLMSYKIRMQSYENYELDMEDALETIRRVDNLSRGLEKKCYLVGWQTNGHDTGFPYFGEVNPRHRRPMDKTSLESLKWLIKEAKEKYNTTITLHVNFSDAYPDDDPIGQGMIEDQLAIRENDGSIRQTSQWSGHTGFMVSAYANYFTGNWQRNQIDPLLEMLPELEGQSVHPDAWYSWGDPYYGLGAEKTTDAQRRSAKYMRDKYGMDLTTEFDVQFVRGLEEDHVLYFPMIWQRGWTDTNALMIPSYFQSSVNETSHDGQTLSAAGRYFGEGTAVEPNLWGGTYAPITLPGLKQSFAEKELTRQYLNTLLRNSLTDDVVKGGEAVLYSGNGQRVVSAWNGDNSTSYKRTITVGEDVVLQEPGNVFMPMVWRANKEIQAWSKDGYTDKMQKLPIEWKGVEQVDIYDLNFEGLRFAATEDVTDGTFSMDMKADQTTVVVPAGEDPNSTEGFASNGTVQFLGRDTETDGNWTKEYGEEGYEIFDSAEETTLPESVEVSYVNGKLENVETGYVVEKYTVIANGEKVGEFAYNAPVKVEAPEAPEGKVFAGWEADGKIVSLSETYKFYVANHITLTARYEAEAAVLEEAQALLSNVVITDAGNNKSNVKFVGQLVIPKGYKLVNAGLVWSTKDDTELVVKEDGTGLKPTFITKISDTNQFSVTIKGLPNTMSIRGKIFAKVRNAEGNESYIYSGEEKAEPSAK